MDMSAVVLTPVALKLTADSVIKFDGASFMESAITTSEIVAFVESALIFNFGLLPSLIALPLRDTFSAGVSGSLEDMERVAALGLAEVGENTTCTVQLEEGDIVFPEQ